MQTIMTYKIKLLLFLIFTVFVWNSANSQVLTEDQIQLLAEELNKATRGKTGHNGIRVIGCTAIERTLFFEYRVPSSWVPSEDDKENLIEDLIVQGTAEMSAKNKIDLEFLYYNETRLLQKISINYSEFESRLNSKETTPVLTQKANENTITLTPGGLKEFVINTLDKASQENIVQGNREFPDNALILVYSSLSNLDFRSSLGGINKVTYNKMLNRYEILVTPSKQIIFVHGTGFIEKRIALINPTPKEVFVFEVIESREKKEYNLENTDHVGGEFIEVSNHPKSNGVNFKIKVYNGWTMKEGDLPSITKQIKYETSTYTISIIRNNELKYLVEILNSDDENEINFVINEFLSDVGFKNIIDVKNTKIHFKPCIQFEHIVEYEHLGMQINMHSISWLIIHNDALIALQFFRPNKKEYEILDLVAKQITNSFFILN
jgi:hypothetical protein